MLLGIQLEPPVACCSCADPPLDRSSPVVAVRGDRRSERRPKNQHDKRYKRLPARPLTRRVEANTNGYRRDRSPERVEAKLTGRSPREAPELDLQLRDGEPSARRH